MSGRPGPIAVVGCGSMGSRRLRALAEAGAGDLVAVDADPGRASSIAAEVDARTAPTLENALALGLGAVVVATPNALHLEAAEAAMAAGAHLLVEKPLAHALDGVESFVERHERSGLVGLLGMNWKFHPAFAKIKEHASSGVLGDLFSARLEFGQFLPDWHPWEDYRNGYSARRDLGGGVLLDAHEFEYARWFVGDVVSAFALVVHSGLIQTDTEDSVSALLHFENAAVGEIHLDYLQRAYSRSVALHGANGSVFWSARTDAVEVVGPAAADVPGWTAPERVDLAQTYLDETRHFLACLEGRERPRTTFRDGLAALRVVDAVRRSGTSGRLESVA